jgi:hypothetical protein
MVMQAGQACGAAEAEAGSLPAAHGEEAVISCAAAVSLEQQQPQL